MLSDGKNNGLFRIFFILTFAAVAVLAETRDIARAASGTVIRAALWIPVLAVIAVFLFSRKYRPDPASLFLLGISIWFAVCCLFNGRESFGSMNCRMELVQILACTGVVFPAALILDDVKKRRFLHLFLMISMLFFAVILWIAFIGVFRGTCFEFLDGKIKLGAVYEVPGVIRFTVFHTHEYRLGLICDAFFMALLYLIARFPNRRMILPGIFFGITFILGALLSNGRIVILVLFCGIGYFLFALTVHKKIPAKYAVPLLAGSAGILAAAVLGTVDFMYRYVTHSFMDKMRRIGDFSGRLQIWQSAIPAFRNNPRARIFGLPFDAQMKIIDGCGLYEGTMGHMHSAVMQLFTLTGIPGLLLLACFMFFFIRAALKILFPGKGRATSLADKLLIGVPAVLIIGGLFEITYLFNDGNGEFMNILFMLFSGYVTSLGSKLLSEKKKPV